MNVVTMLKMDLAQPERTQQVFCVQGDTFSRTVAMELLADRKAWQVPEGTSVLISYYRPDGVCGTYAQLPDGTPAWDIRENTVTVTLIPQMLTAAGLVSAQLKLICGEETVSTFAFQIMVRPGFAPGDDPENYVSWLSVYLPQATDADIGQYLQVSQVDASGRVTGLTGKDIVLPPDHSDRIAELEFRTFDLENSTSAIPQLGNRVTAVERSTGEIPNLKNRISELEYQAYEIPQLKDRVDNTAGDLTRLEGRVQDLENASGAVERLNGRVDALETDMGAMAGLEDRLETVELTADTVVRLDARVTALESNNTSSYPAMWETALEECIDSIWAYQQYNGTSTVTFAYFSDNHNNGGCAGGLISRVMDECSIPFSFYCGDMVSAEALDDIRAVDRQVSSFNAMMAPVPRERDLRALGEHDLIRTDTSGRVWSQTSDEVFDRFFRRQFCRNQCVPGIDGTYFYVDDTFHKIRFVVLDPYIFTQRYQDDGSIRPVTDFGFGQEQIDWLTYEALHFEEEDWAVVFISHCPISGQDPGCIRDAHLVLGILSAFLGKRYYYDHINGADCVNVDVDFQNAVNADLIGWFSGQTHNDSVTTLELSIDPDLYNFPFSVVTIEADGDLGHSIDFVTIDKVQRTVFLTRLGHGESRSFTY